MVKRNFRVYGFGPDHSAESQTDGRHSRIYGTIRNYEKKDKEPQVLAKVLHERGKDRPISVGYMNREHFITDKINPLVEELTELDEYFGEYIPPYYLEVADKEKYDEFGDLDVPAVLYSYRVEAAESINHQEQAKLEDDFIRFLNQCRDFLQQQLETGALPILLPDLKAENFMFGSHMGDEKKRLYFIDQFPPFVDALLVVNGLNLQHLVYKFPFLREAVKELEDCWNDHWIKNPD